MEAVLAGTALSVRRVSVCGVSVDCVDGADAIERVGELLTRGIPSPIFAVNPEKVVQCSRDSRLKGALEGAALLIPDGIGVVMAVRMLHRQKIARVPGCELMPALCAYAAERGFSIFLFGGAPGIAELAAAALMRRNPSLRIAGCQHGYLDPAGTEDLVQRINRLKPDMLFVALGSPRQELWISENIGRLDIKVCQAVGGTFDVLAGKVQRAPSAFRRAHLEWLHRLISQPMRAGRQSALPIFAVRVLKECAASYLFRRMKSRRAA